MANEKRNVNNLTAKQQVFCDLYRASEDPEIRGNAKKCYMLAFGASAASAEANGPRLTKEPNVAAFLEHKREVASEEADISEARILREVAALAYVDPAKFYDDQGNLLQVTAMPEDVRRAMAGLEVTTEYSGKGDDREEVGYTKKVKWHDKKGALELLMRYKKMLTDNINHSGEVKTPGVVLIPGDMTPEQWLQTHYQQPKAT